MPYECNHDWDYKGGRGLWYQCVTCKQWGEKNRVLDTIIPLHCSCDKPAIQIFTRNNEAIHLYCYEHRLQTPNDWYTHPIIHTPKGADHVSGNLDIRATWKKTG